MTRDECKTLVRAIASLYPNWHPAEMKDTVDVWFFVMSDQSLPACMAMLKAYSRTNRSGFAPSPADLLGQVTDRGRMTPQEAWSYVLKAIPHSTYYSRELWEKMPEQVRVAVTPDQLRAWAMDENFNQGVVESNFIRSFRLAQERAANEFALPEDLKAALISAGAETVAGLLCGKESDG